jgi:uncharacterized protein
MRLGLISDIHGNYRALIKALDLLSAVDHVLCLGDCISQHGFSNEVVRVLRERQIATIWGNHEAMFYSPMGERTRFLNSPDPDLLAWLGERPLTLELNLLGRRILMVHSTPKDPIGDYVGSQNPSFAVEFASVAADIVLCGHTHQPFVKRVGNTQIINPGSVGEGRPEADGFVSSCAILHLPNGGCELIDFQL